MSRLRLVALALVATVALSLAGAATWAHRAGYGLYVVHTGSMVPTFDPGDVLVDRPAASGYHPGDVVTVQISAAGDVVSHRLRSVDAAGLLHTKGDANRTADVWALHPSSVHGVLTRVVPHLGYLLIFLRQPTGLASVLTSGLALALLWGLCFPASEPTPRRRRATAGLAPASA